MSLINMKLRPLSSNPFIFSSAALTLDQISPQLNSTKDLSASIRFPARRKETNPSRGICCGVRVLCRLCKLRSRKIQPHPSPAANYLPPQSPEKAGKKTLVLDLDETLVHSSVKRTLEAEFSVNVTTGPMKGRVYVKKRPGLDEFLRKSAELYELVVFTASLACYAGPVLDILDPNHRISHRLYREHCVLVNGEYVKDLSRLGRDMSKVIIIDVLITQNSPSAYLLHPNNGFPIKSFINDSNDAELGEALSLLKEMQQAEDVAEFLSPHQPELIRRATIGLSPLTI